MHTSPECLENDKRRCAEKDVGRRGGLTGDPVTVHVGRASTLLASSSVSSFRSNLNMTSTGRILESADCSATDTASCSPGTTARRLRYDFGLEWGGRFSVYILRTHVECNSQNGR